MFGNIPDEVIQRLKEHTTRIAVVGASNNQQKYGNIITRNLLGKGYKVIPINPKEKEIEGLKAYPSVADAEKPLHIVNFVTPPEVSLQVIRGMPKDATDTVWFQEGSFNEDVIKEAQSKFKNVVYDACIMVVTNYIRDLT